MRSIYLTTRFPRQAYGVEYIYIYIYYFMCNCGCCGYFTLCVIVAVALLDSIFSNKHFFSA